jgi:uncharacterized membrane protein
MPKILKVLIVILILLVIAIALGSFGVGVAIGAAHGVDCFWLSVGSGYIGFLLSLVAVAISYYYRTHK